jgi:surface antigen
MAFNFKQDLSEYQGQENQSIRPEPSQIDVPEFRSDFEAFKNDQSPVSAMLGAKKQTVAKMEQKHNTINALLAQLPDPQDEVAVHQANAPQADSLTPTANIEIDYANRDLSREDITSVPEGTVGGHCGVYAQNVVKLENGSRWTVGDTIKQKKESIERYRAGGHGFKPGEDAPEAGHTVIIDPGTKWGHVAVINKINPDGTATLTESNWNWDKRVTHNRKIRLDDPSIVGFIRTK